MSEQSELPESAGPGPSTLASMPSTSAVDASVPDAGRVGEWLRAARESRGLTVAEVALSLKLGPRQVEALETEDWASLPGNTMIRGFVRNYARLLNLDPGALMRALDAEQLPQTVQLEVSAGTSVSLPQSTRRVERRDLLAILAGVVLLVLAVLAYFFVPADAWQWQLNKLIGGRMAPVVGEKTVLQPAPVEASAPKAVAGESVTVLAAPKATVLSDVPPTPLAGDGLKLGFVQPAWVEVRDGGGQLLLSEVGAAGSQRLVEGQPPFSLVVGNATQVTVQYRGRAIDLAPYSKGDVARLTIE